MNIIKREFQSIHEFVHFLSRPNNPHQYERSSQKIYVERNPWPGTHNWSEANDLLNYGWTDGAKRMNETLNALKTPELIPRPTLKYDVVGATPSVPRYLQGIPTNMVRYEKVPKQQPVISIIRGIDYSSGVSPERAMEEGVKCMEIVRALEQVGYSVKLWVAWAVRCRESAVFVKICIKQPGERMNISKMAYPLAHVSFLRRHIFKYLEVEDIPHNYHGYGTPCLSEFQKEFKKEDVFIPRFVDKNKILEQYRKK